MAYFDNRSRRARLEAETRDSRSATEESFKELRSILYGALSSNGPPAAIGDNNSGLNDTQMRQIASLLGATRAISQNSEAETIGRQVAIELDNSGIINTAHNVGEYLASLAQTEADRQQATSHAPPITLTPGLHPSLGGADTMLRSESNGNRPLSQGIAFATTTANQEPPMRQITRIVEQDGSNTGQATSAFHAARRGAGNPRRTTQTSRNRRTTLTPEEAAERRRVAIENFDAGQG
jgi:hypothetical protein